MATLAPLPSNPTPAQILQWAAQNPDSAPQTTPRTARQYGDASVPSDGEFDPNYTYGQGTSAAQGNTDSSSPSSALSSALNPQTLGLALSGAGSFANAALQGNEFNAQLAQQLQLAQMGNQLSRDTNALQSTQLDPYKQQKDLAATAVKGALGQYGPSQAVVGSAAPANPAAPAISAASQQYLNPSALANAASTFELAQLNENPNAAIPNLQSSGFGQVGAQQDQALSTARQSLQNALKQSSAPSTVSAPGTGLGSQLKNSAIGAGLSTAVSSAPSWLPWLIGLL